MLEPRHLLLANPTSCALLRVPPKLNSDFEQLPLVTYPKNHYNHPHCHNPCFHLHRQRLYHFHHYLLRHFPLCHQYRQHRHHRHIHLPVLHRRDLDSLQQGCHMRLIQNQAEEMNSQDTISDDNFQCEK